MAAEKIKFDFKKTYGKLQDIVRKFEQTDSSDMDIEARLRWFEDGMKHVQELREYVAKTELRIKELKKQYQ